MTTSVSETDPSFQQNKDSKYASVRNGNNDNDKNDNKDDINNDKKKMIIQQ